MYNTTKIAIKREGEKTDGVRVTETRESRQTGRKRSAALWPIDRQGEDESVSDYAISLHE